MKNRILSILLTIVLLLCSVVIPMSANAAENSGYLLGDSDGNGRVEAVDATYIQSYCAQMNIALNPETLIYGDVDRSGEIEVIDATFIQRYLAQIPTPCAVGEFIEPYGGLPTFTVSNATASAGETVNVVISVKNNPGILGMTITLSYDGNMLTLTDASSGSAVSDVLAFTRPGRFTSPCNFTWDGIELSEDQIKDGEVLVLTFRIADNAVAGRSYPITITYEEDNIIDANLKPVEAAIINGSIRISG